MTPREVAQVAKLLPPGLRDALRAWAKSKSGTATRIGAILDQKPRTSYAIDGHLIGPRQVDVLAKHKLAETWMLWLVLTPHGAEVASWLAGIEVQS